MYNLLIAFAVAAVTFVLGWTFAGTTIAGFIPASLALLITYVLLARRVGKKFQSIATRATKEFESNRMENGIRILETGFALSNWQFFIGPQIHGQLGMIAYLQRDWKKARVHLSQAWRRDWRARSMHAALDHRQGRKDAALETMNKLTGFGGKDPTFWGLYAYIALEAKKRDKAIGVLNAGLKKCPDSPGLKQMANAIRNKKKPKMKAFAPAWYQYFPEQMPRSAMMANAQAQRGMRYPQPRR
jgi:hypothetical protein